MSNDLIKGLPPERVKGQAVDLHNCGVQQIKHRCECGAIHILNVGWHDRRWLRCSRYVWAVRPTRSTKLEIRPWPGDQYTGFLDHEKQEQSEKDLAEIEATV